MVVVRWVRENRKRLRRSLARMAEGKEDGGDVEEKEGTAGARPRKASLPDRAGACLVCFLLGAAGQVWVLAGLSGWPFPLSGCARRIGRFGTGHKVA